MARGPIEIPVAVDTGGVEKSIKNGLIDPIEDAEDALKKLGDGDYGRDIDREMDKAQDATEKFDKELDQTRKSLDKLGFAARTAGDDAERGMDRAKAGVGDFKDEANSTAREAAASFDGSAESIGEAFQEVAANAFSGFGPAGAVAGLAAAAGIGLAIEAFNQAGEAAKKAKEDAYSYAFGVLDSGRIIADVTAFRTITEDIEKMAEAQKIAKATGIDLDDVIRAMATGDGIPALIDGLNQAAETGNAFELNGLITMLQGAQEGFALGADGAAVFSEYLYNVASASGTATGEVDYLGRAIVTLPDGKEVVIDAATKTASENIIRVDDQLNNIDKKTASPTIRPNVDTSPWDNWRPTTKTGWVRGVAQAV